MPYLNMYGIVPFETLLQRGAREMDRMTWFGMENYMGKTPVCNFQGLELNAKPLIGLLEQFYLLSLLIS